MKRNFLLVLFASLLIFAYSCSDDDDPVSSNSGDIVGTWTMQKFIISSMGVPMETDVSKMDQKIEFKEDGTYKGSLYTLQGNFAPESGNYVHKDNKLTVDSDGTKLEFSTSISGNNLTISSSTSIGGNEMSVKMTYIK